MKKILTFMLMLTAALMCLSLSKTVKAAEVAYFTENFESYTAGTNYQGSGTLSKDNTDIWTYYYGITSTSAKYNGNNGFQMRIYKNGNIGYLKTVAKYSNLSSVTFYAKVSDTNIHLNLAYSSDGSVWTDNKFTLDSSFKEYTLDLSNVTGDYYLKFEMAGTKPSSDNYQLSLDDISFNVVEQGSHSITYNNVNVDSSWPLKFTESEGLSTLPTPVKEGYEFVGWYESEDFSGNPIRSILEGRTTDLVIYAKFNELAWHKFTTSSLKTQASLMLSYNTIEPTGGPITRYKKVTDVSELTDGCKVVLGAETSTKAYVAGEIDAEKDAEKDYLNSIETTSVDGYIEKGNGIVFSVTKNADNTYTFTYGGNTLKCTAVKKVAFTTTETTANDKWKVEISDGVTTVSSNTSSYGRFLYNVRSPRFTTYTSGASTSMLNVSLYIEVVEEPLPTYELTSSAIRFGLQGLSSELKEELDAEGATYWVKVSNNGSVKQQQLTPVLVDGKYQFALVITDVPSTDYLTELIGTVFVKIGDTSYELESKTGSVKTVLKEYVDLAGTKGYEHLNKAALAGLWNSIE